jgi:hypothetical protein
MARERERSCSLEIRSVEGGGARSASVPSESQVT